VGVLNRAWQALYRFIADANTIETGRGERESLRAAGRRFSRLGERVNEWMEEAQRNSDKLRREAKRNERRSKRRALTLLLRQLNARQRQEFRAYKYFHVIGGRTGNRYRIRVDIVANIDVLRGDGTVKHRLCVGPSGDVPVYDVMAAQLLHLQEAATEQRFVQQGNVLSTLPEDQVSLRTTWIS